MFKGRKWSRNVKMNEWTSIKRRAPLNARLTRQGALHELLRINLIKVSSSMRDFSHSTLTNLWYQYSDLPNDGSRQ